MFPFLRLKPQTLDDLEVALCRAVDESLQRCPWLLDYPCAFLEDVRRAVRQDLNTIRPAASRISPSKKAPTVLLPFRAMIRIRAEVYKSVTSELDGGHFKYEETQKYDIEPLLEAVYVCVLALTADREAYWPFAPTTRSAALVAALPDDAIARICSHVDAFGVLSAASTCKRWRSILHHGFNRKIRLHVKVHATAEHLTIGPYIDVLKRDEYVLQQWQIEEEDLQEPYLRLIHTSTQAFELALAALPRAERLYMRVYDDTPGTMHLALGTAGTDRLVEFIGVNWNFWRYMEYAEHAAELFSLRVHELHLPRTTNVDRSMDKMLKRWFPHVSSRTLEDLEYHKDGTARALEGPSDLQHSDVVPCRLFWRPPDEEADAGPGLGEHDDVFAY
ncbi:hypothetical protein AURDEDRAFT_125014 [Auricularia subglabra TFB-10046 SS5]|nr:hypothetical protein AURDEDRAFT_125014 [Auricularia subglabra TFB-10046 SS5]